MTERSSKEAVVMREFRIQVLGDDIAVVEIDGVRYFIEPGRTLYVQGMYCNVVSGDVEIEERNQWKTND